MSVEYKNVLRRLSESVPTLVSGMKNRQWGLLRQPFGDYTDPDDGVGGIPRNVGSLFAKDQNGMSHEFLERKVVDDKISTAVAGVVDEAVDVLENSKGFLTKYMDRATEERTVLADKWVKIADFDFAGTDQGTAWIDLMLDGSFSGHDLATTKLHISWDGGSCYVNHHNTTSPSSNATGGVWDDGNYTTIQYKIVGDIVSLYAYIESDSTMNFVRWATPRCVYGATVTEYDGGAWFSTNPLASQTRPNEWVVENSGGATRYHYSSPTFYGGFSTGSPVSFGDYITARDIKVASNNTYDIGSASFAYKAIYVHTANVLGDVKLGGNIQATSSAGSVLTNVNGNAVLTWGASSGTGVNVAGTLGVGSLLTASGGISVDGDVSFTAVGSGVESATGKIKGSWSTGLSGGFHLFQISDGCDFRAYADLTYYDSKTTWKDGSTNKITIDPEATTLAVFDGKVSALSADIGSGGISSTTGSFSGIVQGSSVIRTSRTNSTDGAFSAKTNANTVYAWDVDCKGLMTWGSGSATRDTNLYRSASGTLKTDGNFTSGGGYTTLGDGSTTRIVRPNDTGILVLAGGGADFATRQSYIQLYGGAHATKAKTVEVYADNGWTFNSGDVAFNDNVTIGSGSTKVHTVNGGINFNQSTVHKDAIINFQGAKAISDGTLFGYNEVQADDDSQGQYSAWSMRTYGKGTWNGSVNPFSIDFILARGYNTSNNKTVLQITNGSGVQNGDCEVGVYATFRHSGNHFGVFGKTPTTQQSAYDTPSLLTAMYNLGFIS